MLQADLDERLKPLLSEWNAKAAGDAPRTLRIEPVVRYIRYITGGKRFWGGGFAGNSAVMVSLKVTDSATGDVIAEPDFYQHANGLGAAYSFGATDKTMLIRISNMITEYMRANYPQAVGGSISIAPDIVNSADVIDAKRRREAPFSFAGKAGLQRVGGREPKTRAECTTPRPPLRRLRVPDPPAGLISSRSGQSRQTFGSYRPKRLRCNRLQGRPAHPQLVSPGKRSVDVLGVRHVDIEFGARPLQGFYFGEEKFRMWPDAACENCRQLLGETSIGASVKPVRQPECGGIGRKHLEAQDVQIVGVITALDEPRVGDRLDSRGVVARRFIQVRFPWGLCGHGRAGKQKQDRNEFHRHLP
jgi:hypothetical protein